MLFIGTITRMIEGERYKHNHEPAAYPAAASASVQPRHARCSCRGDIWCSACSTRNHPIGAMAPVVAATPVLSRHDARREWRYERRAMRDYRRAARHGYGYGHPIAVPVAAVYSAGQSSFAPGYYEANRIDQVQHEARPPRYDTVSWDPPRTSVEVLTEGKGT